MLPSSFVVVMSGCAIKLNGILEQIHLLNASQISHKSKLPGYNKYIKK